MLIIDDHATVSNMDAFKIVAAELRVLYSAKPSDKHLLIAGLQELKRVVVATRDAADDPSLKIADVSFAMGTEPEVTQQSSEVVLASSTFHSIIETAKEGRNLILCLQKFL